ncbi:MAG: hypothetical protein ACHP9Z_28320, partial [Streptosporangiales bacterium]
IGVVFVSGEGVRRRSRQVVPRPKLVRFTLTLEEFDEVSRAAERAGMARGAYAADVTLAAACGIPDRTGSPLREVLVELMTAGRAGPPDWRQFQSGRCEAECDRAARRGSAAISTVCARVVQRLDETAERSYSG